MNKGEEALLFRLYCFVFLSKYNDFFALTGVCFNQPQNNHMDEKHHGNTFTKQRLAAFVAHNKYGNQCACGATCC